ncbi:MAG TPA: phosphotransferase, partial [bacterium]|nr:phosphotransferase [bacterium]
SVLLQRHFEEKADATLLLVPGTGPLTVDTDSRNLIVSLTRPAGKGKYTFSGVHILRRDILDFLPATEPCSIITAYEKAIQAGLKVIGLSVEKSFWADTGTPTDYLNVHARIADAGLRYHRLLQQAQLEQARRRATLERSGVWCSGAIGLGKNIRVVPGTQLHNIVIWDNSRITRPFFYTQGVFTRTLQPTRVPWNKRKPDSRILNYLGLKENEVILKLLRQQGSGRRYWRLISEDQTWVWCVYNRDRRENGTFASLSDFLEKLGLNVPHVYLHLVDSGEILMADLGDTCLLEVNHSEETERLLRVVLEQIACLHVEGTRQARLLEVPLQNGFTKGLYDWERDYFREYFLNRLLKEPWLWFPVAEEYQLWRTRLLYQPLCVLHRDLQSANIMVSENKPYLIDFQGMRPGCSCYDVASLLF